MNHLRFYLVYSLIVIILPASVFGQSYLLRLYEQQRISELQERVSEDWQNSPDFYHQFVYTLFIQDGHRAVDRIKKFIKNDPNHPAIPALVERLAQYQFSQGLYNSARETFSFLADKYPNTTYGEFALYHVARCWNAIGRIDSSQIVMEQFHKRYPRSKLNRIAAREARSEYQNESNTRNAAVSQSQSNQYTIQTGAFTSREHAQIQQKFLEDKGYHAAIYNKWVHQKKYYVVCVGTFQDSKQAKQYGESLAKNYRLDYQVIPFKDLHSP